MSGPDIIMGHWDFVPPPGGISCVDTAHTPLAEAGQVTVLGLCYLCQQCTALYVSGRFAEPQADGVFLL